MGDKVLQSACSSSSSLWTVTCHMGWVMGWLEAHRKCGGMRFRFCLGQLEWSSCILGVRSGAETHSSSPAQQDRYGQIKLAPLQSNESNGLAMPSLLIVLILCGLCRNTAEILGSTMFHHVPPRRACSRIVLYGHRSTWLASEHFGDRKT